MGSDATLVDNVRIEVNVRRQLVSQDCLAVWEYPLPVAPDVNVIRDLLETHHFGATAFNR